MPEPSHRANPAADSTSIGRLTRALTREEWQPLANALAQAAKQHGLKCDTQCTIDSARVLRVPGHRK